MLKLYVVIALWICLRKPLEKSVWRKGSRVYTWRNPAHRRTSLCWLRTAPAESHAGDLQSCPYVLTVFLDFQGSPLFPASSAVQLPEHKPPFLSIVSSCGTLSHWVHPRGDPGVCLCRLHSCDSETGPCGLRLSTIHLTKPRCSFRDRSAVDQSFSLIRHTRNSVFLAENPRAEGIRFCAMRLPQLQNSSHRLCELNTCSSYAVYLKVTKGRGFICF